MIESIIPFSSCSSPFSFSLEAHNTSSSGCFACARLPEQQTAMNSYYFQTICAGSLVYAVRIFGFPSRPGIVYPLNAQSFSSLLLPPNHRISLGPADILRHVWSGRGRRHVNPSGLCNPCFLYAASCADVVQPSQSTFTLNSSQTLSENLSLSYAYSSAQFWAASVLDPSSPVHKFCLLCLNAFTRS